LPGCLSRATLAAAAAGVFNLFCGYLKPQPQIGSGWIWAHYADPFTWSLYSLIVGQLGDMNDKMIMNQNGQVS